MEAGLPLFVLKRLLGHTSLSTTSKYLHVSREHLAKVKSPLDALLSFGRNNLGAELGVTAVRLRVMPLGMACV